MKRLSASESLPDGFRRLLAGHIEDALAQLIGKGEPGEAVHQARKSIKQARSLLRLIRPAIGDAQKAENDLLRSIGGKLSATRDAQVLNETLIGLEESAEAKFPAAHSALRRHAGRKKVSSRTAISLLRKAA